MQTTLLGLAIAFIIALTAALVGPFFIDWNQYRPQFEVEASRVIGAPVRVEGAIDARLLPAPILRLQTVSIGAPGDPSRMRADKLDVEFSLSSLMRGEWRASELSLGGVALDLGLDRNGRIDWPLSQQSADLGALAIDRLNVAGNIVLHDAASGKRLALDDVVFKGEVRALAGSTRGEGALTWSGTRWPFRISTGQAADDKGTRLRLVLDPDEKGLLSADLDGVVTLEQRSPHFEGMVTLARASGIPWRVAAKTKADSAAAAFEQIDLAYGPDDVALKFAGSGGMRFGAAPGLEVKLSGQQLDADRLLAKLAADEANGAQAQADAQADVQANSQADIQGSGVLQMMPALRKLAAAMPRAPVPTQLDVAVDQIALAGRPVRDLDVRLHGDAQAWTLERIALQAPGNTQIAVSGRVQGAGAAAGFAGPLDIQSGAPDVLIAWLQGHGNIAYRGKGPARIAGNAVIGTDSFALDAMSAEIDGSRVGGRIALTAGRLDASLTSPSLDLDALAGLAGSLFEVRGAWPDEAQLSLDVGRARLGGQDIHPLAVQLAYGPKTIALERLKIGGAGRIALDGQGVFDRDIGTGTLTLAAAAPSFDQFRNLVAPFAPSLAARLASLNVPPGDARMKLTLGMVRAKDDASRVDTRAVLDLAVPQIKGQATLTAQSRFDAKTGFDFAEFGKDPLTIETRLSAERGAALVTLLGAEPLIASRQPVRLEADARGAFRPASRSPWKFKLVLSGKDLDAQLAGEGDPWADKPAASMKLIARRLDLGPLFGGAAVQGAADARLSAQLGIAGDIVTFDDLDAAIGAMHARGRLVVARGEQTGIDGRLSLDTLDLASVTGLALGASGRGAAEPLGRGWSQDWHGHVTFEAARAMLPGGTELRSLRGTMRGDGRSLIVSDVQAGIGDGAAAATIEARRVASGTAIQGQFEFSDVDGAALRYRGLAAPEGRVSLRMALASEGRSAAALANALSGDGVLTLDHARIAGLDTKALDLAVRAGDSAPAINNAALEKIVAPALSKGELHVASAQIPFDIRDGRWRVASTALEAGGSRAVVSGGYDMAADQMNIRAVLSSPAEGALPTRPEIQVFWHGTPAALTRTVDVAALSSWIALRSIDRETRRLEQLQQASAPVPPPPKPELKPEPKPWSAPASKPALKPDPKPASAPIPVPAASPAPPPAATATAPAAHRAVRAPHEDAHAPPHPHHLSQGHDARKRSMAAPLPAPRAAPVAEPQLAPLPPPIDIRPAPR